MKIDKSKWSQLNRPAETNPVYYYPEYFHTVLKCEHPVEVDSLKIEFVLGTNKIPEGFTHVEVDYDRDFDDSIDISLRFIKYSDKVEIPNYEKRLLEHNKKVREAGKKSNKVLEEWKVWCKEQIESVEYKQYLELQAKYGK